MPETRENMLNIRYIVQSCLGALVDRLVGLDGIEIVVGNGNGVDANVSNGIIYHVKAFKVFEADWEAHGKKAGPIRNRQMAQYADALIALPAKSGSKGTMNTVDEFLKLKKPVVVLWQDF